MPALGHCTAQPPGVPRCLSPLAQRPSLHAMHHVGKQRNVIRQRTLHTPAAAAGDPAPFFGRDREEAAAPAIEVPAVSGWQRRRLEKAYQTGRRNINIRQLVGDTHMERRDVLTWLKERAKQPDKPKGAPGGSPYSATQADAGSSGIEEDGLDVDAASPASTSTVNMTFAERQAAPGGDFARKRMKKATLATLERVFDRYRWPPEEVILGVCQLHREMSPARVKLWFEERRQASGR